MALIKIRGRLEPIIVDDVRAQKIKDRKFGVDGRVAKAESNELLDLGDWAGEYGRIVEVEMTKNKNVNTTLEDQVRLEKEKNEQWFALSPKEKALGLGWFKLCYSSRTKDWKWNPDEKTVLAIRDAQEKWFSKHPRTYVTPTSEFGDLLPPRESKAKKKSNIEDMAFDKLAF